MNKFEKIKAMDIDEMAEFLKSEEEMYDSDRLPMSGVDILDIKQWLESEVKGMTRERECINCKFSYEEECLDAPCYEYKCIFGEDNCIMKSHNCFDIEEINK